MAMPGVPKYSDRINLFFVLFGNPIPLETPRTGIMDAIRKSISFI